jgi:hypothetical protein
MRILASLLSILFFSPVAPAQSGGPPVTRIVTRLISASVDPASFAAQPKTLYLAGDTYARLEETPDLAQKLHGLMIVNEPDIWMINLLGRTGQHQVDPGPVLVVQIPILPPGGPKEFATLEFGKEIEFFTARKAVPADAGTLEGTRCNSLEFIYGDYRLVLYVTADSGVPFQLEIYRDSRLNAAIRYVSYERGLPFKPELFKPPADVKITEAPGK